MITLAACTIVAKNYLPFARVLAESFLEHHPEGRFFVLLVDRNEGHVNPAEELFTLIEVEELDNLPELPSFLFKYTLLEANTAVKPFFLAHLLERFALPNLVYFDPDILITGSLDTLAELVDRHAIVLTPHLTDPIDDDAHPSELAVLQSGAYNLGFIALRRCEQVERLLAWWQDRLYERCVVRIEEGLFVDQKWIDLVPGLFPDVHVLADPGYNVAYWNLHGRRVVAPDPALSGGGATVNGRPLVFFHFSGIDPENLQHVSKHQDRFTLADLGDAARLYRHYRDRLMTAGWVSTRGWSYAYGTFSNGVRIPDVARRLYLELGKRRRRFGDPFDAGAAGSFFAWLNEPRRPGTPRSLSRLIGRLYDQRPDLKRLFPNVDGRDFLDFCGWLHEYGRHEFRLDDAFLAPIPREGRATLFTVDGVKRRLKNRLKRAYHSQLGQATRRTSKRILGHGRYKDLRQRLRGEDDDSGVHPAGGYHLPLPASVDAPGVNLVGYFQAETGMGEAARLLAAAFAASGVPVSLHSLELNVTARQEDRRIAPQTSDFPHGINLFVANADQVAPIYQHLGAEVFAERVNVGFWLWELESFPERWRGAFDLLHEIWTPSTYCADAISKIAPVPVRRLPIPVDETALRASVDPAIDRGRFGLPEEAFVVLYMFNYLSFAERKNPLGLIRAFQRAFSPSDGAVLVLKTSQSDFAPEAHAALERQIAGGPVQIIDEYLSRGELMSLVALADAYASLHRAEGFGLTLAEAMALGKPVIATPYSGNVDFFNLNNGFPVRYRLVDIEEDVGPYRAGRRWAEPDEEHAAELLRWVFERRDEARAVAERGRDDIDRELGVDTVARRLESFVEALLERVRQGDRKLLR